MKPIEFEGQNVIYAKDQPEYNPLPAHRGPDGTVTSCWEFNDEDIEHIIKHRKIFISQMTFNKALQPINVFNEAIFLTQEDLEKE